MQVLGRQPIGLLLTAPYVIFLVMVMAWPLIQAVWISFHDYFFTAPSLVVAHPFVGLDNYRTALTDPSVRQAFGNIIVFLVINVPLTVILSLILASALNSIVRWATLFRIAFYIPYVTASVSLIGVWMLLFSQHGVINSVLGPFAPDPSWLVNSRLAMPSIALYVTWKQLGFYILLYLAALQNISRSLYESASVDGAGAIRQFWHITVPGVRQATVLVLILAVITGSNLFTEPYLLTAGGGPDGASLSPVLLIYQKGIQQTNPDVASAIGVVLVVFIGILSVISNRVGKED
ncbi:Carbohydrate ABC transporter membrane protein 1, CUT1 [Actinomyces succiniciruminis]|uniref:Carbohydrate ABC transporter membrane protein 1, CUT1 n=2 Tax=Actinomyces succiniciruminis TaxID=1522002 RepID=A0A1L7RKT6_9ACTO|nr:Carbohydrate ABC transporter membrane protein 1, CUT1 [Actinomyces succiniciruminis]